MTRRIRIAAYGASRSARLICNSLRGLRVYGKVMRLKKAERSRYSPRPNDIIINWGSSNPRFPEHHYINKPSAVGIACNKLSTFQVLNGVDVPIWMDSCEEALSSLHAGRKVYARLSLTGHSGRGIVVMSSVDELIRAPLYTVDTQADQEYRIHVVKSRGTYTAFDVQQKKRRNGVENSDTIRNHSNGWVFCREGVIAPETVLENAKRACEAIGLDFCGVDVGYSSETDKAFVYEVNTACGLEGTTLDRYTMMLSGLIEERERV